MATRDNPYGAFNFMVKLGDTGGEDQIVGGFSDVSGLGNEVKFSEYRNGNDKANHVRKIANVNTTDDVTLKRGRDRRPAAVHLAQGDPRGRPTSRGRSPSPCSTRRRPPVCSWVLQQRPAQEVGRARRWPAKGGGEVAMEELHLVAEQIDFKSP